MAELRPYNPTWRDRIAAALIGDARPGSARANFAEGVTGSRGLGTTGMGLVDLTPAGIPMAAQEANRSAMAGDTVGAIANAMAVIPAAKVPIAAAKGAATQGIRAYHGSPHSFDRFDMSKAGSTTDPGFLGRGMYFTTDKEAISGSANKYETNLALNNPLQIQLDNWGEPKTIAAAKALGIAPPSSAQELPEWSKTVSEIASKKGHDGIVLDYGNLGYKQKEISVFDDSLIEILRKYGLAGATAGMGGLFGLGAMSPQTQQPAAPPQL